MDKLKEVASAVADGTANSACTLTKWSSLYAASITGFITLMIAVAMRRVKMDTKALAISSGVAGCFSLVCAWNVFKFSMIDRVCNYEFPADLKCEKYKDAWQNGFYSAKIASTTATTAALARQAGESDNKVARLVANAAETTANVGNTVSSFKLMLDDWETNYQLYKCAVDSASMDKTTFVAMRTAMYWVPIVGTSATAYLVLHDKIARFYLEHASFDTNASHNGVQEPREDDEGDEDEVDDKTEDNDDAENKAKASFGATISCIFIGLIVGTLVGKLLSTAQTGRWRRKLNLPFFDVPRMIL